MVSIVDLSQLSIDTHPDRQLIKVLLSTDDLILSVDDRSYCQLIIKAVVRVNGLICYYTIATGSSYSMVLSKWLPIRVETYRL